jgi:molybdate transport system substrate-binding protein
MSESAKQGVEITLLAGGAMDPGLVHVGAAFHKETGHTVKCFFNLGGLGLKRMEAGEVFDVLVHPHDLMEKKYRATGFAESGGIPLGRVGIGVLIRPGAPVPDISGVEAFKRALSEAESILYTTATSGGHIEEMLRKIGMHELVQAKAKRVPHGPELMDRLAAGKGREFAFLPVPFALTRNDVKLVGPLPEELQHYLDFEAVPSTKTRHKDVAWAFARYCGGPGRPLLVASGVI